MNTTFRILFFWDSSGISGKNSLIGLCLKMLMTLFPTVKRTLMVHGMKCSQRYKIAALDSPNPPLLRSKGYGTPNMTLLSILETREYNSQTKIKETQFYWASSKPAHPRNLPCQNLASLSYQVLSGRHLTLAQKFMCWLVTHKAFCRPFLIQSACSSVTDFVSYLYALTPFLHLFYTEWSVLFSFSQEPLLL